MKNLTPCSSPTPTLEHHLNIFVSFIMIYYSSLSEVIWYDASHHPNISLYYLLCVFIYYKGKKSEFMKDDKFLTLIC